MEDKIDVRVAVHVLEMTAAVGLGAAALRGFVLVAKADVAGNTVPASKSLEVRITTATTPRLERLIGFVGLPVPFSSGTP